MLTVDTNLLVRFAANDDPKQAEIATELLQHNRVQISVTVLLETEWVLRSRYRYGKDDLVDFFRLILSQQHMVLEDSDSVTKAMHALDHGMDFADALHCARARSTFVTFDRPLANLAEQLGFNVRLL